MAGGNVRTFLLAGVMTVLLFLSIYSLNLFFDSQRQGKLQQNMDEVLEDIEDIEASYYLIEYLESKNGSCESLIEQLNYLELRLWKLDDKIKRYREAEEEFGGEDFYIKEKRRLNRREIIQLSFMGRLKNTCSYNQTVILYFYGNCRTTPNCGEQGYVLSYINEKIDPEIAILSFDGDRETQVVNTLMKAYNVTSFPCLVIEGNTYCGLWNREEVEGLLCKNSPHLSICQISPANKTTQT
ncbi:MAG: hypothetical protein V1744_03400 [Candidatus Altiarchaeota archaeon]